MKRGKVKSSYPNSARLNNYLIKELSKANDTVLEATTDDANISTKQIKQKVRRKGKRVSFFQLACVRIKEKYDTNVFSVARSEISILHNIKEFITLKGTGTKEDKGRHNGT